MSTTMFNTHQREDNNLYEEHSTISPTNALFPPELSAQYMDPSQHLGIPPSVLNNRQSMSALSDGQAMAYQQAYLSRPPSLSPSSQSMIPLQGTHNSPPSSASPSSNFSVSANDDFLFANSFSSNELDMFLFQNNDFQTQPIGKQGHSLFLPQNRTGSATYDSNQGYAPNNGFVYNPPNSANSGFSQDEAFDMLNLVNASPADGSRRFSGVSTDSYVMPKMEYQQATANMSSVQAQMFQQLSSQTGPTQWMPPTSGNNFSMMYPMPAGNGLQNGNTAPQQTANGMPSASQNSAFQYSHPVPAQTTPARVTKPQPTPSRTAANRRVSPNVKTEAVSPAAPVVGKHNKTERRYRQKVQAAQADLRDAVPALRVLYATSTEEQRNSTDFRAADGTVDGLGEITRPNASAKTTIFLGARLYIELLQRRVNTLQRKVGELEQFRLAVAGEDDLRRWQGEFEMLERDRQAQEEIAALARAEDDSFDEEEEEEEEDEPKRKKPRVAAKPRAKAGVKGRQEDSTASATGVRVFAAFAMSFSLLPSASMTFRPGSVTDMTSDAVFSSATSGQVLSRLPLITAEHTTRLLSRGLPLAAVPHPHTLVDWSWRLLVAIVLVVLLGPLAKRRSRSDADEEVPAGSIGAVAKDSLKLVASRWRTNNESDSTAWNGLAAGMLGGALYPTALARFHVILRLNRTAKDAYSLSLLALLQPELPFLRRPKILWQSARSRLTPDSPVALAAVLALPFEEAVRSLELLPKTASPIAAIAEQISLVHINDLFSQLFIRLVDASARSGANSVKSLLENLESRDLGTALQSSAFDREIRTVVEGVPRGSSAHALGLVLVGLWGVFTGPVPSAQAALASALAAEEVKGAGAALASVSAMLELLYPGSSSTIALDRAMLASSLPSNALAIDKLALVCIEYIRLLSTATALNVETTRLQRLEASRKVQKATSYLRLVLTQTTFVGLDEDKSLSDIGEDEDDEMGSEVEAKNLVQAKERLVGVLSLVGKRAAGRAVGRDEDSGLEGDLDEL